MRNISKKLSILLLLTGSSLSAGSALANEQAKIFGTIPAVQDISLSPDGQHIAFISSTNDGKTSVFASDLSKGGDPIRIASTDGNPDHLMNCSWVSNARLACRVGALAKVGKDIYFYATYMAFNDDGSNLKILSKRQEKLEGSSLSGGSIIDWLPGQDNKVMITRYQVEDDKIGSLIGNKDSGLLAETIDTRTGATKPVERATFNAVKYITDGTGNLRIKGVRTQLGATRLDAGEIKYFYKLNGKWEPLSDYDYLNRSGFIPSAVDPTSNRVFGFEPINGRLALVSITLDGDAKREIIYQNDKVDVDNLIRIGRDNRVIGVSYAEEKRTSFYFDKELKNLSAALSKALGTNYGVNFVDASADEKKLLIWAGSDTDAGQYYLFDKTTKQLRPILAQRPAVEDAKLAPMKAVTYKAADGTVIPAYLTLPAGSSGKNLPAIVMPHGGPDSRDEWGFDWLSQYYASQGFAVLQPNFRGSSGYGDAWYEKNGFQSWRTSIGDVTDAGKWLISEGIAKPSALSIVGWSYGGYAALQSAVLDPNLFKAVVAIAPVTDLAMLKDDSKGYYDKAVVSDYIGSGSHIQQGSPAQNVEKITVPVLMFHGDYDGNVNIEHSRDGP